MLKTKWTAGAWSGIIAGSVMALAMMLWMHYAGKSIWTMPNLISALWLGRDSANATFGLNTVIGFCTHMAASVLMGIIAIPFIANLSAGRTLLAAFAYALGSYPLMFATLMSWLNPVMVERTGLIAMTYGHVVFGIALGLAYLWLRPETDYLDVRGLYHPEHQFTRHHEPL